jgi:hypothetical protein
MFSGVVQALALVWWWWWERNSVFQNVSRITVPPWWMNRFLIDICCQF